MKCGDYMAKIKNFFIDITCFVINVVVSILMVCPIYKDRFVLPGFDEQGNNLLIESFCTRTPFERLTELNINWLLMVGFVLFALGIVLSIHSLLVSNKNKVLFKIKKIVLITSTCLLIVLLLIASNQVSSY